MGTVINDTITTAWRNALEAATKYGDYVTALSSIDSDIERLGSSGQGGVGGNNTTVGRSTTGQVDAVQAAANTAAIRDIVAEMKVISSQWHGLDAAGKKRKEDEALSLSKELAAYGLKVERRSDGVWYILDDKNNPAYRGKKLYEKYHTGGVVGNGIRKDEEFALLQKGEWVLKKSTADLLTAHIKQIADMTKAWRGIPDSAGRAFTENFAARFDRGTKNISSVTNNQPVQVAIGDTIINGADSTSVRKHEAITRNMVNDIAKMLKQKW